MQGIKPRNQVRQASVPHAVECPKDAESGAAQARYTSSSLGDQSYFPPVRGRRRVHVNIQRYPVLVVSRDHLPESDMCPISGSFIVALASPFMARLRGVLPWASGVGVSRRFLCSLIPTDRHSTLMRMSPKSEIWRSRHMEFSVGGGT